jgi:hypothetical protein
MSKSLCRWPSSWGLDRASALGPLIELAVLHDGEADTPVGERRVVDADALGHRGRVIRTWVVATLPPLDQVHDLRRSCESALVAAIRAQGRHRRAPQIRLEHIAVVDQHYRGVLRVRSRNDNSQRMYL